MNSAWWAAYGQRATQSRHNGAHELKRAERCPPVEGTTVALFMELLMLMYWI